MEDIIKIGLDEKFNLFVNYCIVGNIEQVENLLSDSVIYLDDEYFNSSFDPVYSAVYNDDLYMVKLLLKYGAKVNKRYLGIYETPLHVACYKGYYEIAELLIKFNADVNIRDISSKKKPNSKAHSADRYKNDRILHHPLFYAVVQKHVKIVKLLLETGSVHDTEEDLNENTLVKYFEGNFDRKALDTIKLLFNHRIIQSMENLFSHAVVCGDLPLLQYLINEGINVNTLIKGAFSPLGYLCLYSPPNYYQMMEIIVKNGSDPNMHDKSGKTPLILCSDTSTSTMEMLLKFGANINGQDSKGNTALHHCKDQETLTFLMSRGINTEIRNNENKTAKEIFKDCRRRGFYKVYENHINEISKMKSILKNCGISLYDILIMNRHELSRYIDNANLLKIFKDKKFCNKFPIFGTLLKQKFERGKERKELMNSNLHSLENLAGMKIPEVLCFEIFKYFSDGEINSAF